MTKETMIVETISGKLVNLNNFAPHEILLSDIVQGLSLVNRFNGRFARIEEPLNLFDQGMLGSSSISVRGEPVTVLQHSYAMYLFAKHKYRDNPRIAIECLLHDAPEAYTGDIISPLKAHIPMLHDIEQRIFNALSTVYGLPLPDSEAVKELDALALRIEWETFVARGGELEEYKTRAAHYGERAADADAMDDVAMRRALYEARSYTPAQLADKALLILSGTLADVVRNTFKKKYQSDTPDSTLAAMKAYTAPGDLAGEALMTCGLFIDGVLYKHMELESVTTITSEINNLYVMRPIENGSVTVEADIAVLLRISRELERPGIYKGNIENDHSLMQVIHRDFGELLTLNDKTPYPGDMAVVPSLVDRVAALEPGAVYIIGAEDCGLTDTSDLTRFACKVMMEAREKCDAGVYSSRVQTDGKKDLIIFYKEDETLDERIENQVIDELTSMECETTKEIRLNPQLGLSIFDRIIKCNKIPNASEYFATVTIKANNVAYATITRTRKPFALKDELSDIPYYHRVITPQVLQGMELGDEVRTVLRSDAVFPHFRDYVHKLHPDYVVKEVPNPRTFDTIVAVCRTK